MKFLHVTVPCPFTCESNECITEATGWSQCRVVHLHLSVFPPLHAGQAPTFDTLCKTWDTLTWCWNVWLQLPKAKICIIVHWIRDLTLQRWTVPFYISACSSDVTYEAFEKNQTWRHCIEISIQRGLFVSSLRIPNVPSKYYDVIDRITGMQRGTSATLVCSYNAVVVLLAYALIVFSSMLYGWFIPFY